MEPLTVKRSVTGLLVAANKISRLLRDFTASPDSPSSAKYILNQLTGLVEDLKRMQEYLPGSDRISLICRPYISLEHIIVPLTVCVVTFSELEKLVDGFQTQDDCVLDAAKWSEREEDISKLAERMRSQKLALDLLLHTISCTDEQDFRGFNIALTTITAQTVRENADFSQMLQQRMAKKLPSNIAEYGPAALCARERLIDACRAYLEAEHSSSLSELADPPSTLVDIDDLSQYSLPLIATDIPNRSWYCFDSPSSQLQPGSGFTVFVKTLLGQVLKINVSETTTCLQLKEAISREAGPPPHQQYIVHEVDHRWIPEDVVLTSRGVGEGSRLQILLPIWGRQ